MKQVKKIIPKGVKEFFYGQEVIYARNKKNADRKARNKGLLIQGVVWQSEQLPKTNCTLNRNTCGKGSGCKYPHCYIQAIEYNIG